MSSYFCCIDLQHWWTARTCRCRLIGRRCFYSRAFWIITPTSRSMCLSDGTTGLWAAGGLRTRFIWMCFYCFRKCKTCTAVLIQTLLKVCRMFWSLCLSSKFFQINWEPMMFLFHSPGLNHVVFVGTCWFVRDEDILRDCVGCFHFCLVCSRSLWLPDWLFILKRWRHDADNGKKKAKSSFYMK